MSDERENRMYSSEIGDGIKEGPPVWLLMYLFVYGFLLPLFGTVFLWEQGGIWIWVGGSLFSFSVGIIFLACWPLFRGNKLIKVWRYLLALVVVYLLAALSFYILLGIQGVSIMGIAILVGVILPVFLVPWEG